MNQLQAPQVRADDCQLNFEQLRKLVMPATVTALPTQNLFDGMEVYYVADSTNGVVWHLKYNAATSSTYKWNYVGGIPVTVIQSASTSALTTTPTLLSGPTTTVSLAGEYQVQHGGRCYHQNLAAASVQHGLYVNGGSVGNNTDSFQGTAGVSVTLWAGNTMTQNRVTIGAGQTVETRVWVNTGTGSAEARWLSYEPYRVI
jgi:hypothetical protein